MQFADAEQWLGLAALVSWIVVTGLSVAGRLPRVPALSEAAP